MTFVISVVSGKGGAGKTTTAVNLAAALAERGQKVTLVDGNLTTPNVSLHLGIALYPTTLNDVIKGNATIKDATYRHKSGFNVIPASLSIDDLHSYKPKNFKKVVRQLFNKKGIIIIDGAAGLGREARASIDVADGVIIVTNPELPAITDALKAARFATRSRGNVMGVIINRSSGSRLEISDDEIRDILGHPILGVIPEDKNVKKSIVNKTPVVHFRPFSSSSRAFGQVASTLLGEEYEERVSLLDRVLSWIH